MFLQAASQEHLKPLKALVVLILGIYFVCQALFPELEKTFFWGEILALIFFFSVFRVPYKTKQERWLIQGLWVWIFLFPVYGIISSYFFWREEVVLYFLVRNMCYFYYAIFFFAAYRFAPDILELLSRYWFLFVGLFIVSHFTITVGGAVAPMLAGFIWLLCAAVKKERIAVWLGFFLWLLTTILNATKGERGTDSFILILLAVFMIIYICRTWILYNPPNFILKLFHRLFWIFFIFFFIWSMFYLDNLRFQMWGMGLQVGNLGGNFIYPDTGHLWRFFFWSHVLLRVYDNPFGIGLGTPLFDEALKQFILFPNQPNEEYITGAHNFIITFLGRLGFPFLILLLFVARAVYGLLLSYMTKVKLDFFGTQEARVVFVSLIAFSCALTEGLFNVVVETPTFAGIFWILFGLSVRLCGDFVSNENLTAPVPLVKG